MLAILIVRSKRMQTICFSLEHFSMLELSELSAVEVADYFSRNKSHLAESMPLREANFFSETFWTEQIERYAGSRALGCELRWFLRDGHRVIGHVGFDQIVRGPFQACYLGYGIDAEFQGRGLMRQALLRSLDHILRVEGLNRVMANYEPDNARSGRLLKSLGFEREGLARRYLKLNGRWRDHVLTSLVADDF
jgi:ribosomal-protein-alanine N-acetyltransferase